MSKSKLVKKSWLLQYDFHQYDFSFREKKVITKRLYFDSVEELFEILLKKKTAMFKNTVHKYDNFHIYRVKVEEVNMDIVKELVNLYIKR